MARNGSAENILGLGAGIILMRNRAAAAAEMTVFRAAWEFGA
jgi:hypothetical protein